MVTRGEQPPGEWVYVVTLSVRGVHKVYAVHPRGNGRTWEHEVSSPRGGFFAGLLFDYCPVRSRFFAGVHYML